MDSSPSFTCPETFIDLLNSQHEFGTQETLPPTNETHSPTTREVRQRWTLPEEKVLVSAWLNTSKDAIIGNDQKGGTFWNRVAAYYAASPAVLHLPNRESNMCKQKWSKMNEAVCKFSVCYECASRQRRSGETEDDVMELAYKLYFQDQKVRFSLEHAWRMLKNDQKWCSLVLGKTKQVTKKGEGTDGCAYSTSSNTCCEVEEQTHERPMEVKAAKCGGKKRRNNVTEQTEGSSVKDLQELWVIKEKDLVFKERLSKQKLLEILIAKSGQLSESEENLKNKLISEML